MLFNIVEKKSTYMERGHVYICNAYISTNTTSN